MASNPQAAGALEQAAALRRSLPTAEQKQRLHRKPSFSPAEAFVLHGLLIDPALDQACEETDTLLAANQDTNNEPSDSQKPPDHHDSSNGDHVLSDEVLFSIPPTFTKAVLPSHHNPARRRSILGLWKAHERGIHPRQLVVKAVEGLTTAKRTESTHDAAPTDEDDDSTGAASDDEVRSEASSWDDNDHPDTYDTWEVLKDEYAGDFGFDFSQRGVSLQSIIDNDDTVGNSFTILGTSADDPSVQPHVLSPPLMDALMTFMPDELVGENYWLRYSLVRDGASLDTLKGYVRGAPYTVVAIETPTGKVFGSFTSAPWRTNPGFYGGAPSFVWKMRHNRRSKCSSLFEQAQLESEIDVFMATNQRDLLQVCRHDQMAVGGDEYSSTTAAVKETEKSPLDESGFAFSLENDLLVGTTSRCTTFQSPPLVSGSGSHPDQSQVFEVAGLEVWSFTPCFDVAAAQRLELTKYFVERSIRSTQSSERSSVLNSTDLLDEPFYQRVGQDYKSQERRDRWEYTNMMNPTGTAAGGIQNSPRFM